MRVYRPPGILQYIYPGAHFNMPGPGRTIYLTFDDGPTDGITQSILEILHKQGVPATFFVSGIQVEAFNNLYAGILKEGHSIGNHGYHHLNGYHTSKADYFQNVKKGAEISGSDFFRPPYGKIWPAQYRCVRREYMVVFWSIMPYDFDSSLSADKILSILIGGIRPGSIIALHDNKKSKAPLILEEFITHCLNEGYSFDSLERLNLVR